MSNQFAQAINELANSFEEFKVKYDERFNALEAVNGRLPGGGISSPDNKKDGEYKSAFSEYVRKGGNGIAPDVHASLTTNVNPDGGYFVPRDTNGRIIEKVLEISPMRQLASVMTTKSKSLEGLADIGDADAGWVGEEQSRPETTEPKSGAYEIPVFEVYAQPVATQVLLEDAGFDVENWLIGKLAKKFSKLENRAFILGEGVARPRGLLSYQTTTDGDDTRAWGQLQYIPSGAAGAFAGSNPADVLYDTVFSLKSEYLANAAWLMTRATLATIAKFKDGNGNYLLTMGSITDKTPFSLLGYPVFLAEDMPQIAANSYAIAFGNIAEAYQIVDREGISLLRDPYTDKGKVKFYSRKRVGGGVINFEAVKLMKFAAA